MPLKDNLSKGHHFHRKPVPCSICNKLIIRESFPNKPFTCFNCKKLKAKARYLTGKNK